jgi:hypothetical protein
MATNHQALAQRSAQGRSSKARVKRDLRTGALALDEALADPPEAMRGMTLLEVIRATRSAPTRYQKHLVGIGARAMSEGVNLMLPVGWAGPYERAWVAEHGLKGAHVGRWMP